MCCDGGGDEPINDQNAQIKEQEEEKLIGRNNEVCCIELMVDEIH